MQTHCFRGFRLQPGPKIGIFTPNRTARENMTKKDREAGRHKAKYRRQKPNPAIRLGTFQRGNIMTASTNKLLFSWDDVEYLPEQKHQPRLPAVMGSQPIRSRHLNTSSQPQSRFSQPVQRPSVHLFVDPATDGPVAQPLPTPVAAAAAAPDAVHPDHRPGPPLCAIWWVVTRSASPPSAGYSKPRPAGSFTPASWVPVLFSNCATI